MTPRAPRLAIGSLPPALRKQAQAAAREDARREYERFAHWCMVHHIPRPEPEHLFASPRRWRFDYAWPALRVALEIDGAVWTQGRHTRGSGRLADMEKFNAAATLGWRVLYRTPGQKYTEETARLIRAALAA